MQRRTLRATALAVVALGVAAWAAPVAHWKFEDNVPPGSHNSPGPPEDFAVTDSSGNGNTLWFWNGGWGNYQRSSDTPPAAMRPGTASAWSFDPGSMGTSGNGVLFYETGAGRGADFAFTDDFTLEGYFKTDGDQSGAGRMEVLFQSQAGYNYLVNLNEGAPGELRFAMSGTERVRLTDRNYADGEWHYVAARYDDKGSGQRDVISLLVVNEDGSRSSASLGTGVNYVPPTSGGNLFVGRQWHLPPNATFQGKLDEVRISTGALSDADLLAQPAPTNTVAYWKFDDAVQGGTQHPAFADASGKGNSLNYWNGGWGDLQRSTDVPSAAMRRDAFPDTGSFDPGAMGASGNGCVYYPANEGLGPALSFSSDFTIEGFFKTDGDRSGAGRMDVLFQAQGDFCYLVNLNEGQPGQLRFAMKRDGAGEYPQVNTPSGVNYADGEWHYFEAAYDDNGAGERDSVTLRVVDESGKVWTGSGLTSVDFVPEQSASNLFVGRYNNAGSATGSFLGKIDEVRITGGLVPAAQTLASDTVAYYRFETDGGAPVTSGQPLSVVDDSSGRGHHGAVATGAGTYSNQVHAPGVNVTGEPNAYSGYFNGATRVDILSDGDCWDNTEMTLEVIFKPETLAGGQHQLVMRNGNFGIRHDGDTLVAYIWGWPGADELKAMAALEADEWYHAAFTSDGTHHALYLNGELVDEMDRAWSPFRHSGDALSIAGQPGQNRYFTGWIDEVRVSNRVLGVSEFLIAPEPATLALLGLGLAALARRRRR